MYLLFLELVVSCSYQTSNAIERLVDEYMLYLKMLFYSTTGVCHDIILLLHPTTLSRCEKVVLKQLELSPIPNKYYHSLTKIN